MFDSPHPDQRTCACNCLFCGGSAADFGLSLLITHKPMIGAEGVSLRFLGLGKGSFTRMHLR